MSKWNVTFTFPYMIAVVIGSLSDQCRLRYNGSAPGITSTYVEEPTSLPESVLWVSVTVCSTISIPLWLAILPTSDVAMAYPATFRLNGSLGDAKEPTVPIKEVSSLPACADSRPLAPSSLWGPPSQVLCHAVHLPILAREVISNEFAI